MEIMDKKRIKIIIRLVKNNEMSQEEALNDILDIFSVSKRFNSTNFLIGLAFGGLIGLICMAISLS
jgi:hypothetical protein